MSTTEDMLATTVDPTIRLDVDRLTEVRDTIAANPQLHDQRFYCGTPRCIAGWTTLLAGITDFDIARTQGNHSGVACALLGVSGLDAENHLFKGYWSHEETLQNLDALIALGKERDEEARLDEVFGR